MSPTLTYTGSLVVTSCWCGIRLAAPGSLVTEARQSGRAVFCPLGHEFVYTDGENDRLKREAKIANERAVSERARADQAEASRRAWKGQTTRLRNRAASGQCPFCGKYLAALDVHVARQHPDEHPRELTEQDAR